MAARQSARHRDRAIAVLRALAIPPGRSALAVLAEVEGVLDGRGSPLAPVPAGDLRAVEQLTVSLRIGEEIDDDVALVVATSGTTGPPKGAMLTAAALIAAASASHDRLGGPGTWLLALSSHHIAGIGVLVRSVLAGTVPVELDLRSGFDPTELPRAIGQLGSGRRYTSMVAAQLAKALTDPAAAEALSQLDAVLLGGGPAPASVLDAATAAGITIVRSYGSSETAGGCVYDGLPLDGVRLRVDEADSGGTGRITVGGVTLAKGYRNPPQSDPFAESGWFHTSDLGLIEAGELRVLGRADEAISTGGLTVLPDPVERVLAGHPAVVDCAVFGVPDERLGQRVAAAVIADALSPPPTLAELKELVGSALDRSAAPRELHIVDELPRNGMGKLDRRALRERFSP